MPTFKLTILANNEAAHWTSWDAKIVAVRDFYASRCTLDVTLVKTSLRPVFAGMQVDPAWYQDNVTPLARGAHIVMFVVPPSDHTDATLMGIETGKPLGVWQTTVFSDEGSHAYVNGVDQGETFTVYALHELAHTFYAILGKTDNTHLYFYAGMPERVLEDLDFAPLAAKTALLTMLLQKLVKTLASLYQTLKMRNMPSNNPDALLPWGTTLANHHNVRALCDLEGLTWAEKQDMTATVWGESEFDDQAICLNLSDGTFRTTTYGEMDAEVEKLKQAGLTITSVDGGLCQWNTRYHGSEITLYESVHDCDKAVRLMCRYWIAARKNPPIKDQWIAHKNGRYKLMLGKV